MTRTPSELLAEALVRALASCGVRDVVYCPGSRSAPLAYALDRAERAGLLRAHVRLDERGAAFVAVGLARAGALVPALPSDEGASAADPAGASAPSLGVAETGADGGGMRTASGFRPVAVVTTSGGAVAELHAGVAEAAHAGVPLVVVSADRPFELRGVGASQTTDQPGLFGPHVAHVWDIPAGTVADQRLTATVVRAVAAACGLPSGEPGPVQLNVGFREPLAPAAGTDPADGPAARLAPLRAPRVVPGRTRPSAWEDVVDPALRTVVVAGDGADPDAGRWAERAGIPLLAEPTSGATVSPAWTPHQQTLLSGPLAREVEQVVVTGRPTLSRPVGALLARGDLRLVVHSARAQWTDVAGRAEVVVPALDAAAAPHPGREWALAWVRASRAVDRGIADLAGGGPGAAPTLVSAARALWEERPGDASVLLLGASNTVRAVDLVASAPGRRDVVSNRGLAGIDGTVATALGLAWGSGRPVRAAMGDLTFLHDASSLMLSVSAEEPAVQILVLDDRGGGIFAGLEHGAPEHADVFERWFGTEQRAAVEAVARAYGARFAEIETMGALRTALARPVRGREVLHVAIPRDPGLLAAVRDVTSGGL